MRLQAKKGEFLSSCHSPTLTHSQVESLQEWWTRFCRFSHLVVDMLQSDKPTEIITRMLNVHAEE